MRLCRSIAVLGVSLLWLESSDKVMAQPSPLNAERAFLSIDGLFAPDSAAAGTLENLTEETFAERVNALGLRKREGTSWTEALGGHPNPATDRHLKTGHHG